MAIMSIEQDIMYLETYGLELCEIHPLYENLLNEKFRREKGGDNTCQKE
jgi:hypothetical protein